MDHIDHILAIFKDGTYYTTTFDLSNRYQGDLLKIEKLDINKVYTALYYDKAVAAFYVKRFSFDVSDNTPVSFISEAKGSYLVALSDDKHPQIEVIFGGKNENRDPELIDAEEFIAKKGIQAKGKKTSQYDVKGVSFIEPLYKPEDDFIPEESEAENQAGEIDNSDIDAMLEMIYAERGLTLRDKTYGDARDMFEMRKCITDRKYYTDLLMMSLEDLYRKYMDSTEVNDILFYGYLYYEKKSFCLDYNDLIILTLHIFLVP